MAAFVGRAEELATLAAISAGDASAVAVIVGDPGCGAYCLVTDR